MLEANKIKDPFYRRVHCPHILELLSTTNGLHSSLI